MGENKRNVRLKPCPFCGEEKLLNIKTVDHKYRPQCKFTGRVTCLMCFASAHTHGFEWTEDEAREEAIKAWNRRVGL